MCWSTAARRTSSAPCCCKSLPCGNANPPMVRFYAISHWSEPKRAPSLAHTCFAFCILHVLMDVLIQQSHRCKSNVPRRKLPFVGGSEAPWFRSVNHSNLCRYCLTFDGETRAQCGKETSHGRWLAATGSSNEFGP